MLMDVINTTIKLIIISIILNLEYSCRNNALSESIIYFLLKSVRKYVFFLVKV